MPSASSKSEKPASTEATDPLKQAIVVIEHKIRNLEKRKSKLDSYKESIKLLTKEQVEAISKYDEVVQQLELSKEYVKQFTVISVESDKLKKKQARKDALEKYTAEVNKVKQVLLIQNVLQSMSTGSIREDFLAGNNGAVKLTQDDLKTLDDLYIEVSAKHLTEDGTPFPNDQFQKAAEYLMAIIEGKSKEVVGSTGVKLKELLTSIQASGYFEQPKNGQLNKVAPVLNSANEPAKEKEQFHENQEVLSNVIVPTQNQPEGNMASAPNAAPQQPIMPGPILPGNPPAMQQNQQPIIANVPNIVPTPVSQVESSFFNAQGFKPPPPPSVVPSTNQNSRQINDVIQSVTGKFSFLQESELDLAEINSGVPGNAPVAPPQIPGGPPSAIPTQTFTNQNFNGQPGGAPTYPPNYPPQPAAFQAFVPAFPAFVTPNATPVQNNNSTTNSGNPTAVGPVNSVNPNIPTSNHNIHNGNNKCNNIPNSIPLAANRNPSVGFNQGQQQISTGFPNQADTQNIPQTSSQPVYQHGNVSVGPVDNVSNEAVRKESEIKEKPETEKQDWSQQESTNWADDCVDTSEWNPPIQTQSDGSSNGNKFSSGRPNRNLGGVPRNSNGYQGGRPRPHRQVAGYRDSQPANNSGGSSNYYQNQNGYQSKNDRNNDFSVGGRGNSDLRDGTFRERGDFNPRDREPRDNYGGGFKRGPPNRGPNAKVPMDRGDRQGQIQRNNAGGPRGSRNVNRQPNGRNGSSFQRQQPNTVGQAPNK